MEVPFLVTDAGAQILAVRLGIAMTTLPCFVGHADKLLATALNAALRMFGTL